MNKPAVVSIAEIEAMLDAGIPKWRSSGVEIEEIGFRRAHIGMKIGENALRPGGTISGPVMFMLADFAFYVAVLASVGTKALAVTTNMNINFLRKPPPKDLIAECRLLKLGSRLAVGEVSIYSSGDDEPVAHASGTYSIPLRD